MCKERFEIYKSIRSEIKHEYELISARLGWLLASQTFLFTALILGIKLSELPFPNGEIFEKIHVLRNDSIFYPILPWLGLVISSFVLLGIWAAILRVTIWGQREKIEIEALKNSSYKNALKAGRSSIHILGLLPAIFVPAAFFITWLFIIFWPINLPLTLTIFWPINLFVKQIIQASDISKETMIWMSASVVLIGLSIFMSQLFIELYTSPRSIRAFLYQIFSVVVFIITLVLLFLCSEILKTIPLIIAVAVMVFIGFLARFFTYAKEDRPCNT